MHVSLLLPVSLMRKRRLRELQTEPRLHSSGRDGASTRPLCSHWRASWAPKGRAGLQKKTEVRGVGGEKEGHSGPREQQEQRQGGLKG